MALVMDQYAERLRRQRSSEYTIRNFDVVRRRFQRWLEERGLSEATAAWGDIEDYIYGLPLAASSQAQELRWLQAAYNYAAKRGTLRHNPTLDLKVPLGPDKEPRIITNGALREIREGLWREKDCVFFHLLAYTGMRRGEIRSLTWENVELADETIVVVGGKGGKLRLVPIHPALGEVLNRLEPKEKFVIPSPGEKGVALETIQAMARRLHPTFTPHDYRRTVASSLGRNEVPDAVVDKILGWAPRSVYRRYYRRVVDDELKRAILRLYADDPL